MAGLFFRPARYAFNKTVQYAFNLNSKRGPQVVDADTQTGDATSRDIWGFQPRYAVPLRQPRTDLEAQRLYNHIRTVAFYLDAIPILGTKLPFNVGVDSILGLVPGVGDYLGLLLGIYQIVLSALFGLPIEVLGWMLLNVIVDCLLGLIPILGDALDVAFKCNLRNLRYLEDHLISTRGQCGAGTFSLSFGASDRFMPGNSPRVRTEPVSAAHRATRPDFELGAVRRDDASNSEYIPAAPVTKELGRCASPTILYMSLPQEAEAATSRRAAIDDMVQSSNANQQRLVEPLPRRSLEVMQFDETSQGGGLGPHPPSPTASISPGTLGRRSRVSLDVDWQAERDSEGEGAALLTDTARERYHFLRGKVPRSLRSASGRRGSAVESESGTELGNAGKASSRNRHAITVFCAVSVDEALERTIGADQTAQIFAVAFSTSLDSSTGYLYLNWACSEYKALASFSSVSIIQQMVFAVAKPPIAKLSDVFGRAEAYLISLLLYATGYLIVSLSPTLRVLCLGIILQSAGLTGLQVLQSIIIADSATPRYRGLLISIVNTPYLLNFALAGPLVDLVMQHGGWRWGIGMWSIVVPLSAMPLLLVLAVGQRRARKMGYETCRSLSAESGYSGTLRALGTELDLVGLLLFTVGWLLVLLPLTLVSRRSNHDLPTEMLLAVGFIFLLIFGWWETQAAAPLVPYRFCANKNVVLICIIGALDFASFSLSWTYLSSFIQVLKGWEQARTSYFAMTQNISSTLVGIAVGSLMVTSFLRVRTLLLSGIVVRLIGVGMMTHFRNNSDPTYMLVLCQLLQGIGGGAVAITMQVACQISVAHADVATVTALELLTTEIGAAIGSAIAGSLFAHRMPIRLKAHLPQLSRSDREAIYGSLDISLSYPLGSAVREGIIASWVDTMRALTLTATLIFLPALLCGYLLPDLSLSAPLPPSSATRARRRPSSTTERYETLPRSARSPRISKAPRLPDWDAEGDLDPAAGVAGEDLNGKGNVAEEEEALPSLLIPAPPYPPGHPRIPSGSTTGIVQCPRFGGLDPDAAITAGGSGGAVRGYHIG